MIRIILAYMLGFMTFINELINTLGTIGVFLLSVLGLYISYRTYKLEFPNLEINVHLINTNTYKEILIKRGEKIPQILHNLYLFVEIVNSGKRTVSPQFISTDKGVFTAFTKEGDFGYPLKENERYRNFYPLDENSIKKIKESKKIYIVDLADRKFFIKKKQSKKILGEINKYKQV